MDLISKEVKVLLDKEILREVSYSEAKRVPGYYSPMDVAPKNGKSAGRCGWF